MSPDSSMLARLRVLTDEELLTHAQAGQQEALAILVNRYQRLVCNVAAKIVNDSMEAEDVAQTVFVDLFQKMDLFDPYRGTVRAWLLQIAYSRSINRRYHLLRRQFYDHCNLEDSIVHLAAPPCATLGLAHCEAIRLVRQLLETLPQAQRIAIELIHFEGLTFEEMAKCTRQTLSAAKHRYYRGILKLRDAIAGGREVPTTHSDFTTSSACGFVSAVRERPEAFAA